MNKGLLCMLALLLVHTAAFVVLNKLFPELNSTFVAKELSYSAIILLLGTFIMYFKFKPGQFVSRFMIVTVFQMLAILSFILALVYLKIKPLQLYGVLFILSYLAGMLVQTLFFLRFSKKTA